jgi:PrgI family protein
VIHRTFRSLDQAPKLIGFTVRQWAALIAGALAVFGVIHLVHLSGRPAITLCVFVIGLPAALTYVSESGGLQLGVLLRDMWRWRLCAHTLPAASPERGRAHGLLVLAPGGDAPEKRATGGRQDAAQQALLWERWD